jgi:hypothetical protein
MVREPTPFSWIWRLPVVLLFVVVSTAITLAACIVDRKRTNAQLSAKYGLK